MLSFATFRFALSSSKKIFVVALAFLFVAGTLFAKKDEAKNSAHAIIPRPTSYVAKTGKFIFSPETLIVFSAKEAKPVATYFAGEIAAATGMKLKVAEKGTGKNTVRLELKKNSKLGDEGYTLDITSSRALVSAKTPAGLFYGLQTLRQMMPPEIYSRKPVKDGVSWSLPCAKISDEPRFAWRGVHLDCARHFYTKEEVKKIIDALSWHKINRFHWHLTEDQGWRLEIKKYPNLTKIGAWRENMLVGETPKSEPRGQYPLSKDDSACWNAQGQYGGFYTQKDVKEIVAYAAERFITIVPEIEIPGHARAAVYAYPEYTCTGNRPGGMPLVGGVYGPVYCPGKEETFKFLEDIFTEVLALFPGKYIHLGADECPKGDWKNCPNCQKRIRDEKLVAEEVVVAGTKHKRSAEDKLQSYTIARMQKFLEAHGRKIIAWDEITEGGIPKGCTVMHWREYTDPKIAPNCGEDLIVCTRPRCYYNWGYDEKDRSVLFSQGGIMPMRQAWDFDPIPRGLDPALEKHVLGAQACFWGEKAQNAQIVEFHFFPRMCAMSEATWSRRENRNYAEFLNRVAVQQKRYVAAGINARPSAEAPLPPDYKAFEKYKLPSASKKRSKKN